MDNNCSYNGTVSAMSLSSVSYPHEDIKANGVQSCSCSLTITSTRLLLRTYDNRLLNNQTLTLSYSNQTVIKSWTLPRNITDVMNRTHVALPFSSQSLSLNWVNNAKVDGGRLWVVIEGRCFLIISL